MISSYSAYLRSYLRDKDKTSPGEHHFVSAYLVPKLYSINNKVPDYINPDGAKSIVGDVVYYQGGKRHFGIEVKLGTVRLTKREFNEWIVDSDSAQWPHLFVGVGHNGIALATWSNFRDAYVSAVRVKDRGWIPKKIDKGYGPMKSIDALISHLPDASHFPFAADSKDASMHEVRFTETLRSYVEANPSFKRTRL